MLDFYGFLLLAQVPNASPTAASASSDMYGAAVLDACEQIKARMKPIATRHNHASFAEVLLWIYRNFFFFGTSANDSFNETKQI